ncbi:MAG: DUF6527 family protein [Pyrinomonadaceae bacterium]
MIFKTEFTEFIPDELEAATVYVSIPHRTVTHKCPCGCEMEVVTPLSPTDWRLTFDGETVSLHPSIGNWSYPCRSHYWIRNSKIVWDFPWSDAEIQAGRSLDKQRKQDHYAAVREGEERVTELAGTSEVLTSPPKHTEGDRSQFNKIKDWFKWIWQRNRY